MSKYPLEIRCTVILISEDKWTKIFMNLNRNKDDKCNHNIHEINK